MLKNSKLYLVLDTHVASYDRLFEIAKEAVKYSVDVVQLRDKNGLAKDMVKFSRRIKKLFKDHIPYIINDRVDIAIESGATGVHLGQEDLPVSVARKLMGKNAIIGVSCQNLRHAKEAEYEGADYIGFGSVFKTLTKPCRGPMDLKLLLEVNRQIKIPVFAIGGITLDNVSLIKKAGVRRIAVTRAICEARNIKRAMISFRTVLKSTALS